jgi:hypothetical protein
MQQKNVKRSKLSVSGCYSWIYKESMNVEFHIKLNIRDGKEIN